MTTTLYGANNAYGITVSDNGPVYTAKFDLHNISKFNPEISAHFAGSLSKVPGYREDADGTKALFQYPASLTMSELGDILVADMNNMVIRQITPAGSVSTFKTFSQTFYPATIATSADKKLFYASDWSERTR